MRLPPDAQRCTARSKQRGERCKNWAVTGRKVCRFHGGNNQGGVANPAFRTGGYSKVLPVGLREAYERAARDPDLMSLRGEVTLLQARLHELAARLGTGESTALWPALQAAWRAFVAAAEARPVDPVGVRAAQAEVERLVERGASAEAAWEDLFAAVEWKAKVAGREWKRLVDLQQMATAEQVICMMGALAASVRRQCEAEGEAGRRILRGFAQDMASLMHSRAAAKGAPK